MVNIFWPNIKKDMKPPVGKKSKHAVNPYLLFSYF